MNGLWKMISLTPELEASGYVFSLQGADSVAPVSFLPTGETRQLSSSVLSIRHLLE